jgi:DNA polymerase II large subunit
MNLDNKISQKLKNYENDEKQEQVNKQFFSCKNCSTINIVPPHNEFQ